MPGPTIVDHVLTELLKPKGFKKKARTWSRFSAETISVVNLQHSQWSKKFYINLGVYVQALGAATHVAESGCHIRMRIDSLCPASLPISQALDLEDTGFSEEQRANVVHEAMKAHGIPWLEGLTTLDQIHGRLQKDKQGFVAKRLIDFLQN